MVCFMVKGFCFSGLFDGNNSIDSTVRGRATIVFSIIWAISAASGVIILIVGLARVSRYGVFLVWDWIVLVFYFASFPGAIEVSVLAEGVTGNLVRCCCFFG